MFWTRTRPGIVVRSIMFLLCGGRANRGDRFDICFVVSLDARVDRLVGWGTSSKVVGFLVLSEAFDAVSLSVCTCTFTPPYPAL